MIDRFSCRFTAKLGIFSPFLAKKERVLELVRFHANRKTALGHTLCLITLLPSFAGDLLSAQAAQSQEHSPYTSAASVQAPGNARSRDDLPSLPPIQIAGKPSSPNVVGAMKTFFVFPASQAAFRIDESSSSPPCNFAVAGSCESDSSPIQERSAAPLSLHIDILEGEGALNNIRQRTAREPIVQVQDNNHKPVAGVLILFAVHSGTNGAGATFANAPTLSVVTDADGRAVARGFQPNHQTGSYTIQVTATLGALTAVAVIDEGNTTSAAKSRSQQSNSSGAVPAYGRRVSVKQVVLIEGVVVGLGFMTALLLNRTSPTSITVGTSTVGPAFTR